MDVINSNTLPGTFTGHVEGTGFLQVPGVIGPAVRLSENTYVNYGQTHSDTCFHNPDECDTGVTFSMWLWLEPVLQKEIILKSKPNNNKYTGYRLPYFRDDNLLKIGIATNFTIYKDQLYVDTNRWFHFSFTWLVNNNIQAFVNGCAANDTAFITTKSKTKPDISNLTISTAPPDASASMRIDHVLVWYKGLTPSEVWRIYSMGMMYEWPQQWSK